MTALLGPPEARGSTDAFFYPAGTWTITTLVGYGSAPHCLHSIRAEPHQSLVEAASVLGWLGVGGPPVWPLAHAGDEEDTARAIRDVCAHFLAIAPRLVDGLSLDAGLSRSQ